MAAKAKAKGPNSATRKQAARKAGKCQLCGTDTPVGKAKSITVTPPGTGKVTVRKAIEGKSYWCAPCAKRKAAAYKKAIAAKQ